MIGKEIIINSL